MERTDLADDLELLLAGTLSVDAFRDKYERNVESPLVELLWESLEHYLSDGDIRERDAGYRAMQEAELHKLVRLLRSDVPDGELARIHFLGESREF